MHAMSRLALIFILLALAVRLVLPLAATLHHHGDKHDCGHAHAHAQPVTVLSTEHVCILCEHLALLKAPGVVPDTAPRLTGEALPRPPQSDVVIGARSATWWRAGGRGPPTA